MMVQGQLGNSQQAAFIPTPAPMEAVRINVGMLGNEFIQLPSSFAGHDNLFASYHNLLASARPAFKLALLKRLKFTRQGQEERIRASLAAVNAAQPINLSLAQWKEIVEEIEDEE